MSEVHESFILIVKKNKPPFWKRVLYKIRFWMITLLELF